jgi:hypothetical protein
MPTALLRTHLRQPLDSPYAVHFVNPCRKGGLKDREEKLIGK